MCGTKGECGCGTLETVREYRDYVGMGVRVEELGRTAVWGTSGRVIGGRTAENQDRASTSENMCERNPRDPTGPYDWVGSGQ